MALDENVDKFEDPSGELAKHSCAFFAQEVLRGAPEPPYNGRFFIAEHHERWDQLINDHRRICVMASRDSGKCNHVDDLVLSADGRLVRVADWSGGLGLAYNVGTHRLEEIYIPAGKPNGKQPCLRILTKTGRSITVTLNHPLRLFNSWARSEDLKIGDRIATPRRYNLMIDKDYPDAWAVGVLIGDGCFSPKQLRFTTSDDAVIQGIQDWARTHGWAIRYRSGYDWSIINNKAGVRPWSWIESLGLLGKTSHQKHVPDTIFTSSNKSVAEFLSGYLETDANISMGNGGVVEFYSVSKQLLIDVQHLLLRIGVVGSLKSKKGKYKGSDHFSWRLSIRGDSILQLDQWVNIRGKRKAQLQSVVTQLHAREVSSGPALDRFPKEVLDLVKHPSVNRQYSPTRQKLKRIAEAENNADLLQCATGDILWDEIVGIEDVGEQETWSLTVPEYHNYVANDIVNHNTYFFDFAYPIWMAKYHQHSKGMIFSETESQAKRILDDIKTELETNPKLMHLVPTRKDGGAWSALHIRLSNGSHIYGRGFGTKSRGFHPNWIVVDDGIGDDASYSETIRNKQKDFFFNAISNMLVPNGQLIVVGTPFHQDDLYGELSKNPEYTFKRYKAINDDGSVLWPERYPLERLMAKKREIGNIRFTREFQTSPIADDMSLFPQILFRGDPVEQYQVRLGLPLQFWRESGIKETYMGVDFAMSSSVQADYTVVWTMGLDSHGNRWILDIRREHGMPYQSQLGLIVEVARKYDPALVFLEDNQMQRIFGNELIRTSDLPIKGFTTTQAKNALDKGVPSLRVLLENQKVRIPRGDQHSVEITNIWIDEMRSITFQDGKIQSVGGHDDTVMAFWICDQAIRHGGFTFAFGEDTGTSAKSLDEMLGITGGEDDDAKERAANRSDNSLADPTIMGSGLPALPGVPGWYK